MKLIRFITAILLLGFMAQVSAIPAKITALDFDLQRNVITLQTNQKPVYKVFLLQNPNRLVVDFTQATNAITLDPTIFKNSVINNVRMATPAKGKLRYVFDLNNSIALKPAKLTGTKAPYQLTIAFTTSKVANAIATSAPIPVSKPVKLRDLIIVLDPGHGGHDPGAIGSRGTQEKTITLAIAKKLQANLQTLPGVKVYLTRTSDTYPSLGQRLAKARKMDADMFISIHADAYRNRSAHGVTIFALSQGRATSEAARWIAERENKSELMGGVDLNDKSYMLRSVLVDLSQTATIGSSLKLGSAVLNDLGQIADLHSTKVEQASLYVLTSPDIPAILIETGFISNRNEERLLSTPSYQASIALAIKQGVEYYLLQNPIPNTIFAAQVSTRQYIAKSGDTIASIARQYGVSTDGLKNINTFKNNKVAPGQVVRIPN